MERTALVHPGHELLFTGARSLTGWEASALAETHASIDHADPEDFARAVANTEAVIHVAPDDDNISTAGVRARRRHLASTRRIFRLAADSNVARVVIPLPPATHADVESGTRAALLSSIAAARDAGLDVRTLTHGVPVGAHDSEPSWLGRAMLQFAAGELRTYVPGTLSVVPSTDVGRALVTLGLDASLANADAVLPSALVTVPQLFEFWADRVGPRSRPRPRPTARVRISVVERLLQHALPHDFDVRRFSDASPGPAGERPIRLERRDSVADSIEAAFGWFASAGLLRCARRHAVGALRPCTSHSP